MDCIAENNPVSMPDLIHIQFRLARSKPDDSCTLACFQTSSVWPKPDAVSQNQIRSRLVLHNMIQAVCRMHPSLKVGKLVADYWENPEEEKIIVYLIY